MVTKKDFKAIAGIIKENSCWAEDFYPEYIAKALADYFEQENLRFDRQKFLDACGLK